MASKSNNIFTRIKENVMGTKEENAQAEKDIAKYKESKAKEKAAEEAKKKKLEMARGGAVSPRPVARQQFLPRGIPSQAPKAPIQPEPAPKKTATPVKKTPIASMLPKKTTTNRNQGTEQDQAFSAKVAAAAKSRMPMAKGGSVKKTSTSKTPAKASKKPVIAIMIGVGKPMPAKKKAK